VNDSDAAQQIDEVGTKRASRRLGRPPLSPQEVRSNRVVTFVTDAQLNELRNLARQTGTSMSGACFLILSDVLSKDLAPMVKKHRDL
jgi:hypothetical protein